MIAFIFWSLKVQSLFTAVPAELKKSKQQQQFDAHIKAIETFTFHKFPKIACAKPNRNLAVPVAQAYASGVMNGPPLAQSSPKF